MTQVHVHFFFVVAHDIMTIGFIVLLGTPLKQLFNFCRYDLVMSKHKSAFDLLDRFSKIKMSHLAAFLPNLLEFRALAYLKHNSII